MRRLILFGAIAAGLTAVTIAANAQSSRSFAFGHWGQVWGTWVWTSAFSNGNIPGLIIFNVDGTISGADASMFGLTPAGTVRASPMYGVWERTGFQSVGGTSLYFVYNATGGLIGWGRARSSLQFSDDFNSLQGKMFVEMLSCSAAAPPVSCPDPQDPAAKWTPANPAQPKDGWAVTAVRLDRVPAGPLP